MRLPSLASGVNSAVVAKVGWPPVSAKARLLAAGASVLAIGIVNPADAGAVNVPGVIQVTQENIAINLLDIGEADPAAEFGATVTDINPGAHAIAEAFVLCADSATCADPGAVVQWARGTEAALNSVSVGGSLSIGADAVAEGASATGAGIILIGLRQIAAAEESAQNIVDIDGSLDIAASGNAIASSGSAVAFAGIGAGISQIATSIGLDGNATNAVENSGDLSIVASANAEAAIRDAAATAQVGVGIYQQALGQEAASADVSNSGTILIAANASAEAANGIAVASVEAIGIVQFADARTEQFSEFTTSGGDLVGTTTNTPSGLSSGTLANSGSITIAVDAHALGDIDAAATGAVLGVAQIISGASAEATIDNSGSIDIAATVDGEGSGTPRGVVFVSGLSQAATAFAFQTVETIDQNGVLTYQLSTTPVGPAVASLTNSGDISVAGDVNVVALGTGSMDEALAVAFVDGFDQYANGHGAEAIVDNSGSFTVTADVTVDSGNVSNAVAIATGIDQYATAYASHLTAVFASGTTTPTSITGGATAMGPATATFANSGALTVVAQIDSHGDQVAFAGATASAVGQYAAGTDASVSIDNSGSVIAVGSLESSGHTAFGGVGAIGFQQGAEGTVDADATLNNGGTIAVLAEAEAQGEVGAFLNATAFGGAQNVFSDGAATASIANSGTIDIRATASGVAGDTSTFDMAFVFADAHGLGQRAVGQQAAVEFENSGTFQLLAEVDASAGEFALASANASGVIQQIASGTAAGTASASIDNSGTILVGAMADVAAGTTAAALAGVESAFVQAVTAGEGASASLTNSGSITMVAEAEALAAGGNTSEFAIDVASAQAFVFGVNAVASATGPSGFADVSLANSGSIDMIGMAHATGDVLAQAIGTAASGLVGAAIAAGTGLAEVNLANSGELTLVGMGEATGGHTAHATGIAVRGLNAFAGGGGDAAADIANTGELTLVADAHASAGTNALAVAIAIDGFNAIAQAGTGDAAANIANSGELNMLANASATALNAQAFAIVGGTLFSGGVFQSAATLNGDASVMAENSGDISIVADALANGEVIASASAVGGPGVNQFAFATSGDAFSGINNSGSLEFVAHAEANADNSAYADAVFFNAVGQFASAFGGDGALELTNDGSISVGILAEARGDAAAGALAIASHEIGQVAFAFGGDATAALDNSGSIELQVGAIAEGSIASATAALATGMIQVASAVGDGEASVALDNSGSIDMAVLASAESPDGAAGAFAELGGAVSQFAAAVSSQFASGTTGGLTQFTQTVTPTGPAGLAFVNSGSLDIGVAAMADGGTSAVAEAFGNAVTQSAGGLDATASLVNDGSLDIQLGAIAEGDVNAAASGMLRGIAQEAEAAELTIYTTVTAGGGQVSATVTSPVGTALVSFENSGSLEVVGVAEAVAADGAANASMDVRGLDQSVLGLDATAEFANDEEFTILSRADAEGDSATAIADAMGYAVSGTEAFSLNVSNGGQYMVLAEASADGATGHADAQAIGLEASGVGAMSGMIDNSGDLLVRADAAGASSAVAQATGIKIGTNADGLVVTNSGVLAVQASTNGGAGQATGIGVYDNGSGGAANVTVTNDGGVIIARVSSDEGDSWTRGTAIDLSAASGSSVLNLVGEGRISGNIDLAAGQAVNVAGGETWFDGVINPECQAGGCTQGLLNIGDGGALFFRHNSSGGDGPSAAFLEELNIAFDGTLIFELPAGADPESAYPQIVTNVANLDGTLLIRSESGLYGDSYMFDDVIDADVRNGQFDVCGIDGNPALLQLNCIYDGQGNVDLELERVAFNAVAGLSRNQAAVGSGIEAVYDVGLTGSFADLVGELFTFGEEEYAEAIDQLTGASHAAYLHSFNSLGESQALLIDRAMGCELPASDASSLSCRPGKFNLWGQIDYANRQHDGDVEAGGYDADRWTATVGGDVEVGPDVIVGASLAKLNNRLSFHDGGRWNADGYQLGAYGAIDRGKFYAKVIGTMAWFDGDSSRRIDWTQVGGTLAGQLGGDPDARVWTLGAHFGYRMALGERSLLTPFFNVDHSSAKLDGLTESGLDGAELAIEDSSSTRTAVTVGAKWATDLGGVIPQAELGYRHLFGDRRATVDASFADEDGSDFDVVSAAEKRGSLLAGLSLGGKAGPVDVRVGYQGLFDGNATSHSASFRIILPLGGK